MKGWSRNWFLRRWLNQPYVCGSVWHILQPPAPVSRTLLGFWAERGWWELNKASYSSSLADLLQGPGSSRREELHHSRTTRLCPIVEQMLPQVQWSRWESSFSQWLSSTQRFITGLPRSWSFCNACRTWADRRTELKNSREILKQKPCKTAAAHLSPLSVAAAHVHRSDVLEELLSREELGQAGEELSHVDEIHAGQDVLVEAQQAQRRAKQELLAVPAEHVPHPTRQVQRQRLTVQCEDPGGRQRERETNFICLFDM